MLQQSQQIVDDFSGGITDYILDAKPNQSATLENFLINPNKKPESPPGSQVFDALMYQIPDGNVRVCGVFASQEPNLFISSSRRIWRPNTTAFAELVGPSSNPAFSSGTTSDFTAWAEWNEHIYATNSSMAKPIKIYKDGSNVYQVRTAGMPHLATSPSCASSGGAGNNYVYAFLYYYTYTVGTAVFEDFGGTTQVQVLNAGAPDVNQVNISSIPVLANGVTDNYDTTNIKVKVYRTTAGGDVFYYVGQVTNGTTTYTDTMSDVTLETKELLYINGGVSDNAPPPLSKYITVVNGVAYYGHVTIGSQVLKNRIYQSLVDDPDSVPSDSFVDLLDEIVGISSFNDNPIVFTKGHVYRLNGYYDELGQGQVTFEDITKTIGCCSHNSIVQTRDGVFWAGDDGFYFTDGFKFSKISDSINERYKKIVSSSTRKSRIYGAFDKKDNRIYWAVTYEDSASDNDSFFILDLRWGIRPDSTFTTRVNGSSFSPTGICFYNGQLIRADSRGYIFKHDSNYTTDPKVDTLTTPDLWTTSAIIPEYKSTAMTFGMPNVRKWVPKILLSMENVTNTSAQIISINDNSSKEANLKEIRFRGNSLWGDPAPIWGAETPYWSYFNLIEEMRRFPATNLRCSFKQIKITSAFTIIYNSDSLNTVISANALLGTNTVTLNGSGIEFPSDVADYYIYFDSDNYTNGYLIQTRDSDTQLTIQDSLFTAPVANNLKWVIKGYPKGELFNILSYVLYFSPVSDQSYKTWRNEQDSSGANA